MNDFNSLISKTPGYDVQDKKQLHSLIADWQIIADLTFSDLLLIIPPDMDDSDDVSKFIVAAQCRPSTAILRIESDWVGENPETELIPLLENTWRTNNMSRMDHYRVVDGVTVCDVATPVIRNNRVIAMVVRETNMDTRGDNGYYEMSSIGVGKQLFYMITNGDFPYENRLSLARGKYRRHDPRVADGFVVLDADGMVMYAAPNAISCFRRIGVTGNMVGGYFSEFVLDHVDQQEKLPEALPMVLMGKAAAAAVLEARGAVVSMRSLPLDADGKRTGALVLCRDITELRWRERQLETKDATISEVHHRVKNNLQAVSSLLRLQARRTKSEEVRKELEEAQRRIETIAVVHEGLSQTADEIVDFDAVISNLLRMSVDLASAKDQHIDISYVGKFGMLPAQDATPLSLILTELVTNCVEHGYENLQSGHINISIGRAGNSLDIVIEDDGEGIDAEADADMMSAKSSGSGLGTQIVNTFVKNDFNGSIRWLPGRDGGTRIEMKMVLRATE
ncbi:sensor histidine kinase [Alloscardovia omnicolens]|uniref:sensor histidine kinase n=1 Tax=Alloscardovia omnicolens TaxID=419015 RepID=UPI002551769A|nr:PAS domain-containing sensor histidine kinase [Alloscardovia omnicolens]MDK8081058.1 histidine kinase N-terminal domain-containing protein [Alloscardovia omnicolens]